MDLELQAILMGLQRCLTDGPGGKHPRKRIGVFCDSQRDLQRFALPRSNEATAMGFLSSAFRSTIAQLQRVRKAEVNLHWIPGHEGIAGNDRADQLAKLATNKFRQPLEGIRLDQDEKRLPCLGSLTCRRVNL